MSHVGMIPVLIAACSEVSLNADHAAFGASRNGLAVLGGDGRAVERIYGTQSVLAVVSYALFGVIRIPARNDARNQLPAVVCGAYRKRNSRSGAVCGIPKDDDGIDERRRNQRLKN